MNLHTSSGRLLNIIEKAVAIKLNTRCIDAWTNILEVKNNQPLLFKRLGIVMTLPLEAKNELLKIKDIKNKNPYLKWEQPINYAFINQNLSSDWASFARNITPDVIDNLVIATDMVKFKNPEVSLEQTKIDELKKDFANIKNEINDSDIDLSLKNFMLLRIEDIINSLEEYKIKGIIPLKDALHVSIGELVINGDLATKSNHNKLTHKFWNLIVNTSVIITIATGVPQITNNIENILPFIKMDNIQQKNKEEQDNIIDVEISNSVENTATV
jgi:low affinity Fe/Cu permease